ncbi:MAG: protein TolB [Desulfobacterales bacterium]|nr:protein TolB [Desulfobacterales bacterium]
MNVYLSARILAIFASILFISSPVNGERVYLDITSPDARKIIFAIPWFQNNDLDNGKQQFGRNLSKTLSQALKFHGIIDIVVSESPIGSAGDDWKSLGADYAVMGRYAISKDQIAVEMRLLDVSTQDMILGKSYKGPSNQTDVMIYRFTDAVIKELTGQTGVAMSQIAFVSQPPNKREKEVFVTDILGKKLRQVTRHRSLIVSPRFSPDGNFLAYTSYHSGNQNLYITDLRQAKTTRAISRRKGMNLAPAWSPDSKTMIVTLSVNGNPDLFIINRQGKIIRQLTERSGINVSPTFSPDGKFMVFVSDRSRKPQLYRMEIASGNVQRLTFDGTENAEPSWSPKENLIVYSSLRGGIYQLCTINPFEPDSSVQITKDQAHHESPSWSPDGNQIIFAKRDGNGHKIYGIMKNGNYQRMLFSFPGSQTYARWAVKNY